MLDVCIPYAFRPVATRTANARSSCCHYCIFVCWNWNFSPLNLMRLCFWLSWGVFREKKILVRRWENLRGQLTVTRNSWPVSGPRGLIETVKYFTKQILCVISQCFCLILALLYFFPHQCLFGTVKQRQNEVVPCFVCLLGSTRHLFESCAGLYEAIRWFL